MIKDKSFESAMQKIALQAEAIELKEARDARRHGRLVKIRGFFMSLLVLSLMLVVFDMRNEIQDAIYAKITPQHASPLARFGIGGGTNYQAGTIAGTLDRTEGKVQNSLSAAAQNAAIRDSVIDEIGSTPTVAAAAPAPTK